MEDRCHCCCELPSLEMSVVYLCAVVPWTPADVNEGTERFDRGTFVDNSWHKPHPKIYYSVNSLSESVQIKCCFLKCIQPFFRTYIYTYAIILFITCTMLVTVYEIPYYVLGIVLRALYSLKLV